MTYHTLNPKSTVNQLTQDKYKSAAVHADTSSSSRYQATLPWRHLHVDLRHLHNMQKMFLQSLAPMQKTMQIRTLVIKELSQVAFVLKREQCRARLWFQKLTNDDDELLRLKLGKCDVSKS